MAAPGRWLPARSHPATASGVDVERRAADMDRAGRDVAVVAPAAAYLWIVPLFSAGVLLSITPPGNDPLVRVASVVVLCVSGDDVAARGNRAVCASSSPSWAACRSSRRSSFTPRCSALPASWSCRRFIAVVATERPLRRPWAITTAHPAWRWSPTFGAAYAAPAYTQEQPLRRYVRALQDGDAPTATWEVASVEPGLDLGAGRTRRMDPDRRWSGVDKHSLGPLQLPVRLPRRGTVSRARPGSPRVVRRSSR